MLEIKKAFLVIFATTVASSVFASIPTLICTEHASRLIDPQRLQMRDLTELSVYRFEDGKLFLKPFGRQEYFYNVLVETEPDRYISGHKTLQVKREPTGEITVLIVHTYKDEIRVSKSTCR